MITDVYKSLEDGIYDFVIALFPDWRIKFALDNGPEMQTPYLVIDVRKLQAIGREQISTETELTFDDKIYTTTIQDYEASVRFEFVGKYDVTNQLAEMAQMLEFNLRSPRGYEEQERSSLSLLKYNAVRRIPVRRDTDTYMYYQLDVTFGYSLTQTTEQDYFDTVGIHGIYHDAGREPDHIIETTIEINP